MDSHKQDEGKLDYSLVPEDWEQGLAMVLAFGAKKYGANTWQQVPSAKSRYYAALRRHLSAWRDGELTDKESGLPHLYHVAVNAFFLEYFTQHGEAADVYDGSASPEEVSTDCTTCPHKDECPNSEEKVVDFDALREGLKEDKDGGVIAIKVNVGNEEAARKVAKVIEETLGGLEEPQTQKAEEGKKSIEDREGVKRAVKAIRTARNLREGLNYLCTHDIADEDGRLLFSLWHHNMWA